VKVGKGKFEPGKPGLVCKDGALYGFDDDSVSVLKIAPEGPRAWRKTKDAPRFAPCLVPSIFEVDGAEWALASEEEREKNPLNWRKKVVGEFILENVSSEIIPVMASYGRNSWLACSLAMRVPDGLDLARGNPGIAYLVAANNVFMKKIVKPWRRARALAWKKRREIARLAGFPDTESTVKILSKVWPRALSPRFMFRLRWLLNMDDEFVSQALRHVPVVSHFAVDALYYENMRNVVGIGFLLEALAPGEQDDILGPGYEGRRLLRDTFRIAGDLGIEVARNFDSLDDLRRYHDRLVDLDLLRIGNAPRRFSKAWRFPQEGPVADFETPELKISLVRDADSLRRWAARMRNCVASYAPEIAEKRVFIYAVEGEEEATLSVKSGRDGWRVDELTGYRNRAVSEALRASVDEWFRKRVRRTFDKEDRISVRTRCPVEMDFPFSEVDLGWIRLRPNPDLDEVLYPVRMSAAEARWTMGDFTDKNDFFPYELLAPVEGRFVLRKDDGRGWRVALGGMKDAAYQLPEEVVDALEDWLFLESLDFRNTLCAPEPPVAGDAAAGIAAVAPENAAGCAAALRRALEIGRISPDDLEGVRLYGYNDGSVSGWFALAIIHCQRDVAWSLSEHGDAPLPEPALDAIEDWLWRRTPKGGRRQGRFDFETKTADGHGLSLPFIRHPLLCSR